MSRPYGTEFLPTPKQFGGIELLKPGSAIMAAEFRPATAKDPEVHYFETAKAALAAMKPSVEFRIDVPVQCPLGSGEVVTMPVTVTRTAGESQEPVARQFDDAAHVLGVRTGDGKGVAAHPLFDLRLRAAVARALQAWLDRSHRELLAPAQRHQFLAAVRQRLRELCAAYPQSVLAQEGT